MSLKYRLGLDMGSTSIGWCVLRLNDADQPIGIEDMGVRIFSDGRNPKDKKPLSVIRREKRAARRRRDRFFLRRKDLMSALVRHQLMPESPATRRQLANLDPWEIRNRAATEQISLTELGRALFHINQRRGFKSNRIVDDQENAKEIAGMKLGIERLRSDLGELTLGQFLYKRHVNKQAVRMRPNQVATTRNEWDFYADRSMYIDEFNRITAMQAKFHPQITAELIQELHNIIFRQRELRRPEPGWCALLHHEKRMPQADPLYQKFRILQEVNNLAIENPGPDTPELSPEDRSKLSQVLTQSFNGITKAGYLSWAGIQKTLKISGKVTFNLERSGRKGLDCDKTSRLLSAPEHFGEKWFQLDSDTQTKAVNMLLFEQSRKTVVEWLENDCSLPNSKSEAIASISLVKGYGRISYSAAKRLIPHLESGNTYDKACSLEGLNHSNRHTGEIFDRGDLPYYGEILSHHALGADHTVSKHENPEKHFGKINNPSVHIALNQLRLIINTLYKRYGSAPHEIFIELARELKLPVKKLKEIESTHKANRALNDFINTKLDSLGVTNSYENRMRYKLWMDLAAEPDRRVCPFSGQTIPLSRLFTDEFEIEHLLPFSRSFDDGRANKVICSRGANRDKRNRTPFEAFAHSPAGYDWNTIMARVENMHHSKRWRFSSDAMDKIKGNQDSMIARLLTDTQYMSRIAAEYLTYVLDSPQRVVTSTGKLTAKLRHHWGLNTLLSQSDVKERGDHRHHAIDALVIACTSRSTIQKLNTAAAKAEESFLEVAISDMPPPFVGFERSRVEHLVTDITISHRPDNSSPARTAATGNTKGQLHDETNWGFVAPSDRKGYAVFATRVPLASLKNSVKNIEEVANQRIRADLMEAASKNRTNAAWGKFLNDYAARHKTRRLRIHREKNVDGMIPILDKNGVAYRYVQGGSNFCMDIWCTDKGKNAGKWQACAISMFDAHTCRKQPKWRDQQPTAWRVMRLHINDVVAFDEVGNLKLARVKKIKTAGIVVLRDLKIANEDGDKLSWAASAKQLQLRNARRVWVDPLGRVHDAGKARKAELQAPA